MATQNVTTTQRPYQAPYLDYGFEEARRLYQGGAPEYFPGQTLASQNPFQTGAIDSLGNFSPSAVDAYTNVGNQFMGGASGAMSTLGNIAGMQQGPQAQMMTMQQLGQYQPMIDQMVDASTRQGMRAYSEQFAPQLNAAAAASGNIGSSRAGIAQGIAQRGIAENAQNVGATAMNNLFNQGNQMNLANANLGQNFLNTQLNAATNLGQFAGTGADMINQADASQLAGLQTNLAAGDIQQEFDQAKINDEMARYNYDQTKDQRFLQDYMNLIQGNYGGTGTQTGSTSEPSLGRRLLSAGTNLAGSYLIGGGRVPFGSY